MSKLSESLKEQKDKIKEMSKAKKIAVAILTSVAIITVITMSVLALKPKYAVLFSKMTAEDSGAVIEKLEEKKYKYRIQGDSILVEKKNVDKLRMELLSQVSFKEGSNGFELFDEKSSVGSTDTETKVMYQRALAGELERTIKSFEEVENAKVNLVIPDKSAFITKPTPASASVTLLMSKGKQLSEDQVKAIVSLISGSVENLPNENVTVVSDDFKLLTEGLYDEKGENKSINSTEKQLQAKKQLEEEYSKKIMNVLEPIYKDKVRVSVNAELNFDAVEQNSVDYGKEGAVVSNHEVVTTENDSGNTSGSPVDNNMNNTQNNEETEKGVTHKENTTNYEVSKKEQTVIKAPGEVQKLSASVVVDGKVDAQAKNAIRNLVTESIGLDKKRGDSVTVESLDFDNAEKEAAQKELEDMKKQEAAAKRNKIIAMAVGGVGALIAILAIILAVKKSRGEDEEEYEDEDSNFDIIIGDDVKPKEVFETLNLDAKNENEHVTGEVKKYATNKPEQVADVVKSWLADDERG